MADLIQSWLRRNARVEPHAYSLTAAWIQALPRDPARYFYRLHSDSTGVINWWIGDGPPTTFAFYLLTNADPLFVSEDFWGGLVTFPLWLASSPNIPNATIVAGTYQAEALHLYEEVGREFISQRQSPGTY